MLQGGEDPYFTDDKICALIRQIKAQYPDCAVTLSIGEKEHDSYQAFFDAGATGICCVMRPRTRRIMENCIRQKCSGNIAWTVCGI